MTGLRDAVHAAATKPTWSQGVVLAKDRRVAGKRADGDEVELEVRIPGRPTPYTVILNQAEGEWECDCPSKERVCSHVVAAVLAMADGALPPPTAAGAPIRYLIEPALGGLAVQRVLVKSDRTDPLNGSLMSLVGTGKAKHIATIEADLLADPLLSKNPVTGERVDRLLAVLAEAKDVRWRGTQITTSSDPVMPLAIVEDSPNGGVRVRIEKDPLVREVAGAGVVLTTDGTLRPIGAPEISGMKLEKLPQRFEVPPSGFSDLIEKWIPTMIKLIAIDVRATALPRLGTREVPRMDIDVDQIGDQLVVFPKLVYGDPPRARIDGGRLVHLQGDLPIRDQDAERKLTHKLRDDLNLVPGRRIELFGRDAAMALQKLASWRRDDAKLAGATKAITLEVTVTLDGSRLDVEVGGGGRVAKIGAALDAWKDKNDLVPLTGGGWGRLPMAWFDKHGERLADLLAARTDDKRVPLYALPDLAKLCEELDEPPPPELDRVRPLLDHFDGIPAVKSLVTGELRPYQQKGVDWLAFCRDAGLGCVLADDMGLGKTVQALDAMRGKTLVVAPTSVLFNWLAEIKRFRPDLTVAPYHGSRRAIDRTADIVLTTYPLLRNDIDDLANITWDTVILDESQTIKNPDSQVARAAYKLKAAWKVTMSGTPIENRLDELWSQLHFTNPGLLGGRADFQSRWAEPILAGDSGAAARLRERIKPFVLRRLKREVARELPPRTDSVMYVELDEAERNTYDAIRAATQREIVAMLEAGGGVMQALEALLRLRQAACHTALLPSGLRGGVTAQGSSKLSRLLEALGEVVADGHRALIFSQWTSLLDLVEPHLTAAGIGFTRLDGTTTDRGSVVAGFQAEDGPPVMLLSLKAGGTGLNLTAADHVFLIDPWWNPAVEDQAADRAHRIGQDKPVMVYRMVARDTVEERILELQDKKRGLADAALSEAGRATAITRDDLLALLA